ncbi:MAG: hypothetical protein NTY22_03265 [Proteobacteria bacterium]|nr:hypothetical protein [Pseudomonadota bacterium]
MSKLVLSYFIFCSVLMANDASYYIKEAGLREVGPQKLSTASKKFYQGFDEFVNGKYSASYNSFLAASHDPKITKEEQGIALYNAALSLERSSKYDKAIKIYKDVTKEKAYVPLLKDSYYRIGACCHKQKNWTCVIESLNNWKNSQSELSLVEEFEFRVRKGTAYFELQSYRDVLDYLESAVKVLKDKKSFLILNAKNMGYPEGKVNVLGLWALEDLAMAYIKIGDNIKVSYPSGNNKDVILDHLNKQIDLKAYYYLKAQDTYIEMLDHGDRDTATKGIYLLGDLYKGIYKNLLESEIPPEIKHKKLNKEYINELKEALKPLLKKSETAFVKNRDAGEEYKFNNEWIDKSRSALKTLWN